MEFWCGNTFKSYYFEDEKGDEKVTYRWIIGRHAECKS
jgi:hypothetical protein